MFAKSGGMQVKGGFYWDRSEWEVIQVPREGGVLPGGEDRRFVRVPAPLLLVLGPVMGGLLVVFLPFVAVAMTAWCTGQLAVRGVRRLFGRAAPAPRSSR